MYARKANGKFLLTAEYAVLDGAWALAIPLKLGQWLRVQETTEKDFLDWQAIDHQGVTWFSGRFSTVDFSILSSTDELVGGRLRQIFTAARSQNPSFLSGQRGYSASTELDFDRAWGLGTSSTLIALIADWAGIDAYQLLADTLGGSGYDIGCAFESKPILYQRPGVVQLQKWSPPAGCHFYFIYQNQKQDSRAAIQAYRAGKSTPDFIEEVNALTREFLEAENLPKAQTCIRKHEATLGLRLGQTPVQARLFSTFPGAIKSMGGWGGDFVLAATHLTPTKMADWCNLNRFPVFFSYEELAF
jgi:mevalonate kinase